MRKISKLLIAGTGALTLAGVAVAAADRGHVMKVVMPDGSVAQIRYVGDTPPQVIAIPAARAVPVAVADPFEMMDRMAYEMDRRMDAMLQQASAMQQVAPNGQISDSALKSMAPGTVSYSFTSYSSGDGASCSQSVQVTSLGANQPPKVERQSQGDCSAVNTRKPTPAVIQAEPDTPKPTPASLQKPAEAPRPKGPII